MTSGQEQTGLSERERTELWEGDTMNRNIKSVWYRMDDGSCGHSVFSTDDAIHIVKALEDYYGEPRRVVELQIEPTLSFLS